MGTCHAACKADLSHELVDVAIVGCGISGAYIAHRLRRMNPSLRILILESSLRVGGRLMSRTNSSRIVKDEFVQEFGGMRIFPSVHKRVAKLLQELDCDLVARPLTGDGNFYYDAREGKKVPLNDLKGEKDFDQVMANFYRVSNAVGKDAESALHCLSVNELWETCFEGDVNLRIAKQTAWQRQLGYDAVGEISAAVWHHENELLKDAGPTHQYQLPQGWQALVKDLARGTDVVFERKLVGVQPGRTSDDANVLRFADGSTLQTKRAFITAPLRKLPEIDGLLPGLAKRTCDSILNYIGTKCYLTFERAWWKDDFGLVTGRSITTLNARMIYYWDADTILCYTAGQGASDELARLEKEQGACAVVDLLVKDLSIAHYGTPGRVPKPIHAGFKAWSMVSSWWRPSVDIKAIQQELLQPCGVEHSIWYANSNASDYQGWMEGAVQASDRALESYMHYEAKRTS
eukprot:TRINITY_DN64946_c0_g1_i1.p1 TRINITY_DN64946_c0_g1~~TRINITY_DN64946_c0_g1_i1.p1  ORF type:complete len:487 (+),score=48.14 TRINITY_DN64946_c0_g1_i1:81-1463(+)